MSRRQPQPARTTREVVDEVLSYHPGHDGLAYGERGDRTLLGTVGHWHRAEPINGAQRRSWVRGTVRECGEAWVASQSSQAVVDLIADDGSAALKAHAEAEIIRIVRPEATTYDNAETDMDEAFDLILDEATETISFVEGDLGHHVHVAEVKDVGRALTITKPERGGKRTCANGSQGDLGCGHSESRHNANGSCRTCGCTTFMVEA